MTGDNHHYEMALLYQSKATITGASFSAILNPR